MRLVAKMLVTWFVASCLEMWNVIEKCDFRFFLCRNISVNSFSWSCLIISSSMFDCLSRIFSRWRVLWRERLIRHDERDSSNLTKATHQTWYERDDFSSNVTDDVSSNLMSCISSNLMSDISSNLMSDISSNLMSDISSNLTNDISSNLTNDISSNLTSDISSNLISDISSNSTKTLSVSSDKRSWMTRESM
jgi:uncharacterized protein (DUF2267 family)